MLAGVRLHGNWRRSSTPARALYRQEEEGEAARYAADTAAASTQVVDGAMVMAKIGNLFDGKLLVSTHVVRKTLVCRVFT